MNILIDIGTFDPKIGASNDMLDLSYYSNAEKISFFVTGNIDTKYTPTLLKKGLKVIAGSSKPYARSVLPFYLISVLVWVFRLKKYKIDLVHINYISWGPSLALAARLCGIPIVARAGGKYDLRNKTTTWVSQYIANCHEQAINQLNSPLKDRVNVVGDLLDVDRISRDREKKTDIFQHVNEAIKIVFVGQISKRKGIQILLEAFKRLPSSAHLYLIGGDWATQGFAQEIQTMLEGESSKKRVHVHNHRSDAVSIINQCDIFVLPSLSEARPRVILEAMSLGKCIVSTKVGGIPGMITHGDTGLLAEAGNVDSLYAELQLVVEGQELRRALGSNAEQYASKHLDPKQTAINYYRVYKKAINKVNN